MHFSVSLKKYFVIIGASIGDTSCEGDVCSQEHLLFFLGVAGFGVVYFC